MKRRRFVLAALLAFLSASAHADDALLKEIAARVADSPVLRAEFSQTKTLAAMRKPFRIAGHFTYARDAGVLWQVASPYTVRYLIDARGTVEIGPDGQRKARTSREAAGAAQAGQIMQALLSADLAPLQSSFVLEPVRGADRWHVTLTPRKTEIARHLARITVAGTTAVEQVDIFEASGDHTEIRFTAIERDTRLNDAEAALFARPD
ncbi:LolA family protein [Denitromonas ohlonensis]|uniref:Outer membrane lipoprotein carrier protein LolA n=2 Tax=Denitromonas TaxID=139331 RepID=A0A557SEZ5_9RHOO|nr:outer membrane lipoprotein carrier protein LolA [Denitromonas ohlonensis]TVO64095.1 outer membrane lipoprotein carrier protein LolA [Denitromonas ohlonensis]TVO75996.1 outer membrane lipoprotein carrier protein LolA [Denitromonas ohlonensis]